MTFVRGLALSLFVACACHSATLTFEGTTDSGKTFVYSGSLQNNQEIQQDDYFVIYDISGLVGGMAPLGWSFQLLMNAPGLANDVTKPDAKFVYNGSTNIVGVPSGTPLGTFTISGGFTKQTDGTYLSQTYRPPERNGNGGDTVHQSGQLPIPDVPEPNAVLLAGGGIAAIVLARIRARRTQKDDSQS